MFETKHASHSEDDDEDYETDDDDPAEIELDAEELDDPTLVPFRLEDETLVNRLAALQDMIPPAARAHIHLYSIKTRDYLWFGRRIIGSIAWWAMTSALLLGLPLALSVENEGMLIQQEKDYYAAQGNTASQQSTNSLGLGQPAAAFGNSVQAPYGSAPPGF